VFVIMPFDLNWAVFEHIRKAVRDAAGLLCIRADQIPGSGQDLLSKIHTLIDRAQLVIADISEPRPNVFYEVGYAAGVQRPLLLVKDTSAKVESELKGRELLEYNLNTEEGALSFERRLCEHLRARLKSEFALLRDMLEADDPRPAYILASPKFPGHGDIVSRLFDERTFGDNLGVAGLLSAFGAMTPEGGDVELISAQFAPPDLIAQPVSLYLIGSQRVNPLVGKLLTELQSQLQPKWVLGPPSHDPSVSHHIGMFKIVGTETHEVAGKAGPVGPDRTWVFTEDHGILIRMPHPQFPDRLVLIMAGAHSLGTGAACLAATRSPLIRGIRDQLLSHGIDMADKRSRFWVLVRGRLTSGFGRLGVDDVDIVDAGAYSLC
jgi:hypothetical protein